MPGNPAEQAGSSSESCHVPRSEHSQPQWALPAPFSPGPVGSRNCASKQPIKPSCTQRRGGAKKADIWARARPTYRIIPVYIRQLFILTWCAAGAGQKGHRALQHLLPPPLLGAASTSSTSTGSWQQLQGTCPPPPCPWLTGVAVDSLCRTPS